MQNNQIPSNKKELKLALSFIKENKANMIETLFHSSLLYVAVMEGTQEDKEQAIHAFTLLSSVIMAS